MFTGGKNNNPLKTTVIYAQIHCVKSLEMRDLGEIWPQLFMISKNQPAVGTFCRTDCK